MEQMKFNIWFEALSMIDNFEVVVDAVYAKLKTTHHNRHDLF